VSHPSQARVHRIDAIIREGGFPSLARMAKALEVSERTIHRDLEHLRADRGAPLKYSNERKGYYYEGTSYSLPLVDFTEQEIFALLVAKNAILHYAGVPYEKHLRTAFKKLIELLPDDSVLPTGDAERFFSFRFGASRTVDQEALDMAVKALQSRRSLKIRYYSAGRDDENERMVDPYHIDNLRGDWYMFAYCHMRKGVRNFALNRIRECRILDREFEPDPSFSYAEYIKDAFGILVQEDPVEVAIEFRGFEARLVRERLWHGSQHIEERPDGTVLLRMRVTGLSEVKHMVLSCGADARVIEPASFAAEVEEELRQALERYKA
jgi:predicted DNA-binding transcriptional regulator YafY